MGVDVTFVDPDRTGGRVKCSISGEEHKGGIWRVHCQLALTVNLDIEKFAKAAHARSSPDRG